jgi:hypothetical protein
MVVVQEPVALAPLFRVPRAKGKVFLVMEARAALARDQCPLCTVP